LCGFAVVVKVLADLALVDANLRDATLIFNVSVISGVAGGHQKGLIVYYRTTKGSD
jgi:hypothetical protein